VKKAFLHIISILLALLVLFSTFSFTVSTHICGGEVTDYSLVGNVEPCEMPQSGHNKKEEISLHTIPCCQYIVETIESSNDELTIVKEFDVQQLQFVTSFLYCYTNVFEALSEPIVPFKDYPPPLVTKDIQILYDTFLI